MGLKEREIDLILDDIINFAEIREFMDTPIKNYSSGMFVRLGFSIAINIHCDILLIDEVLAVGDVQFRKKCLTKMNQFKKEGKTIILVSHNMDTIINFCDRAIWLDKGRILADGKSQEIIEKYLSLTKSE